MNRNKEIKWLYRELPVLLEKKVLTEEEVLRIKNYYGPEPERKGPGLAFIITSVLASLLIGSGIILVFAHNWEDLSRTWRTVFSFLPLLVAQVIYSYAFFKKSDAIAWTESTAAFLMLMIASTIALISQTYNMGGTLEDFVLTCMLLSLPLIYLTNATLVCMFYIAGISFWAMEANDVISFWYLPMLAAVVPHFWKNVDPKETSIRGNLLGWTTGLSLLMLSFKFAKYWDGRALIYLQALLFTILYLIGKIIYRHGANFLARPFQTISLSVVFGYSIFFSSEWHSYYFSNGDFYWQDQVIVAALILLIGFLAFYNYKKKNGINYFVLAYPLLLLFCDVFAEYDYRFIAVIIFNLYLLAFGGFYIWRGIKSEQISFVNMGMFLVSALLIMRFFDQDISFVVKGLVFILLGICFLMVNIVLSKKMKAKHGKEKN